MGNVLTQNKAEIGLGHTPWHDFEESLYPYRCQGTIPMERAGVFNSADIGANIRGYFGGELANAKEVLGNDAYAGRYGSWHVGIYNGAGYTAGENNQNKVPEYRVTVRPLPDLLPGLQASYFGLYGKGNSSSAGNYGTPFYQFYPDWVVNQGYLIYQHPWFMLTAQVFAAKGNQAGVWTTQNTGPVPIGKRADSLWTRGYSVFGDVKVPLALSIPYWQGDQQYPLHAFYRTDWFNADQDHEIAESAKYTKLITGLAYHIYKDNMILLAYEKPGTAGIMPSMAAPVPTANPPPGWSVLPPMARIWGRTSVSRWFIRSVIDLWPLIQPEETLPANGGGDASGWLSEKDGLRWKPRPILTL